MQISWQEEVSWPELFILMSLGYLGTSLHLWSSPSIHRTLGELLAPTKPSSLSPAGHVGVLVQSLQ